MLEDCRVFWAPNVDRVSAVIFVGCSDGWMGISWWTVGWELWDTRGVGWYALDGGKFERTNEIFVSREMGQWGAVKEKNDKNNLLECWKGKRLSEKLKLFGRKCYVTGCSTKMIRRGKVSSMSTVVVWGRSACSWFVPFYLILPFVEYHGVTEQVHPSPLLQYREDMLPYASRFLWVRTIFGVFTSALPSTRFCLSVRGTRMVPLVKLYIRVVSSCCLPLFRFSGRETIYVGAYWPASECVPLVVLS